MSPRNKPDDPKGEKDYSDDPLPSRIGSNLKSLYDTVLDEDVPDDFLKLLEQADEKKRKA